MNFYTDSKEWQFLFRNAIDWDTLIPLYYPSFPTPEGFKNKEELIAFYEELLTATGGWAAETLAPRAKEIDAAGAGTLVNDAFVPSEPLAKTYSEAKEMDVFGMTVDPHYGGVGAPATVGLMFFAQLARACMGTCNQFAFFGSMVDMLERFCDKELQDKFIPLLRKGEISGSMCLTEPEAGSDVGNLRTSAEKQADGTYLLNGTKMFITNGGGGIAFILARVKGAPKGLEGISMFFAEEWIGEGQSRKHNYRVTKLEEKLGTHGSATCEIVYENTVARLVGKENEGFKLMLHLMNEARVSVAMQGVAGIEATLAYARQYAEGRKQFGKTLMEHPLYRRNMEDWETERDALRALLFDTVSYFDIYQRLDMKKRRTGELNEEETKLFKHSQRRVRRRTPLVKYYGAETFTHLSQRGIQALGGYGFIKEYEVERFHRDSFAPLLYEGTSQIQALMSMKDLVKFMMKEPGRFVQSIVASHPLAAIRAENEYQKALAGALYDYRKNVAQLVIRCFRPDSDASEAGFLSTLTGLNQVFKKEYWQDANRFDKLMTHAETMCQALAYVETLKVLAKHATKHPERGELFHRYHRLVTPRFAAIFADWKQAR